MKDGLSGVRKASRAQGDDVTLSRFVKIEGHQKRKQAWLPGTRFEASVKGHSLFRKSRRAPSATMLVSGHNNVKIGRDVRKGKLFRGYWIYTLTFEERATCPRSCFHWDTCYGNNMPFAKRIDHSDHEAVVLFLAANLDHLMSLGQKRRKGRPTRHPRKGVMVRLHALGDFYSVEYVRAWGVFLKAMPRLACFGYTAWPPDSEIGREIAKLKRKFGRRFAIRWSNRGGKDGTLTYVSEVPEGAIACPEQTGRTQCCATCALCWETDRTIAFREH